jgi:chaperone modulatory protein CbpM
MQTKYLIAIEEFCNYSNVDILFINSLVKSGLIEIKTVHKEEFIDSRQLQQLEKYIHFYYELDINLEGIETIMHLLRRINLMQNEIIQLRNRLQIYEPES